MSCIYIVPAGLISSHFLPIGSKSLGSGSHIITRFACDFSHNVMCPPPSYTCLDVISVMDNGADMMEIHNMNDTSTSVEYTQIVVCLPLLI